MENEGGHIISTRALEMVKMKYLSCKLCYDSIKKVLKLFVLKYLVVFLLIFFLCCLIQAVSFTCMQISSYMQVLRSFIAIEC